MYRMSGGVIGTADERMINRSEATELCTTLIVKESITLVTQVIRAMELTAQDWCMQQDCWLGTIFPIALYVEILY
jgi:hypothetical protein